MTIWEHHYMSLVTIFYSETRFVRSRLSTYTQLLRSLRRSRTSPIGRFLHVLCFGQNVLCLERTCTFFHFPWGYVITEFHCTSESLLESSVSIPSSPATLVSWELSKKMCTQSRYPKRCLLACACLHFVLIILPAVSKPKHLSHVLSTFHDKHGCNCT